MKLYAVQGFVVDDQTFNHAPSLNLPNLSLDTLDDYHLSAIVGQGPYPYLGAPIPQHSRKTLLVPARVRFDYMQATGGSLFLKVTCGQHDGILTGAGFEIFEFPPLHFQGLTHCLLLLDYSNGELQDSLDRGNLCINRQNLILYCAQSSWGLTGILNFSANMGQTPATAPSGINNITLPTPSQTPTPVAAWTDTLVLSSGVRIEPQNKDKYSPDQKAIGVLDPTIWYKILSLDDNLLGSYALSLEQKEIVLFTSTVQEHSLVLYYRDSIDNTKNKKYYLRPRVNEGEVSGVFDEDSATYNLDDPARLVCVCDAAERLIWKQTVDRYPKQEAMEENPAAPGKIDWFALAGLPVSGSNIVYPIMGGGSASTNASTGNP